MHLSLKMLWKMKTKQKSCPSQSQTNFQKMLSTELSEERKEKYYCQITRVGGGGKAPMLGLKWDKLTIQGFWFFYCWEQTLCFFNALIYIVTILTDCVCIKGKLLWLIQQLTAPIQTHCKLFLGNFFPPENDCVMYKEYF